MLSAGSAGGYAEFFAAGTPRWRKIFQRKNNAGG